MTLYLLTEIRNLVRKQGCVESKVCSTDLLIDCWWLNVQWQIFHAYSGREQVQQLSVSTKGWDGIQQGNGF